MTTIRTCKDTCGGVAPTPRYVGNRIEFQCVKCGTIIPGDDTDRCRTIGNAFDPEEINLRKALKYADYMYSYKLVDKPCPSCKYTDAVFFESYDSMQRIYKCVSCKKMFDLTGVLEHM